MTVFSSRHHPAHTAETEFLEARRVGAFGATLTLSATDLREITQLEQRADRALPNGLCTLPPAKTCARGNACLTCGHFVTDASHVPEHRDQLRHTLKLIEIRQSAFTTRHGQPLPQDNVRFANDTWASVAALSAA